MSERTKARIRVSLKRKYRLALSELTKRMDKELTDCACAYVLVDNVDLAAIRWATGEKKL
jgi:hypothetical protein